MLFAFRERAMVFSDAGKRKLLHGECQFTNSFELLLRRHLAISCNEHLLNMGWRIMGLSVHLVPLPIRLWCISLQFQIFRQFAYYSCPESFYSGYGSNFSSLSLLLSIASFRFLDFKAYRFSGLFGRPHKLLDRLEYCIDTLIMIFQP